MYKIFEITYNDGGWHTGPLPHFFYIAKNKDEVKANSKKYRRFLDSQQMRGGDIWISEVNGLEKSLYFENLDDFDVSVSVRKKN
jgi:hypothetical protein